MGQDPDAQAGAPPEQPVYLDCNATTPVDPRVREVMYRYFEEDFGNAGSRTHEYGARAKKAVQRAREQIADVVNAKPDEVVFTSGATESDNLAILGLKTYARAEGRLHVVSTQVEHKAVLEPIERLRDRGFEVTLVPPTAGGWVEPDAVLAAVRPETVLVSVMHVNNETGVLQPLREIADGLRDHPAYFHSDAAQGFGKDLEPLRSNRIDLISVSGHKVFGPKGIGALIVRRRDYRRPPIEALFVGGGQERGLRPGTAPVALIAGLGVAAQLACEELKERDRYCRELKSELLEALSPLGIAINGDPERTLSCAVNFSIPGLDSEAAMLALKPLVAISNGSACTSQSYAPSHVLAAMGFDTGRINSALRWSWSHLTAKPDWTAIGSCIAALR